MTLRFGVLGHPLAHSLSPAIHRTFYQRERVDASYERVDVTPAELPGFLHELARGTFEGLNITYPHKEALFEATGPHDPVAAACRAVNTLSRRGPGDRPAPGARVPYRGANTDGEGLALFLERELATPVRGARVLVLGAGGSAKSVLWALAGRAPARLTVINRSRERFDDPFFAALADRAGDTPVELAALAPEDPRTREALAGADLVVHATPVGLSGTSQSGMPWPVGELDHALVVDLNYRSGSRTPFLAHLPERARAFDGRGMLLYQAAEAFRLWFGRLPDTAGMLAAL